MENNTDGLIITVRTTVEENVEEEFNEWQFEEHVPWILSVEGYENVRRYSDFENKHKYVNIWGLTDFSGHDCEDHEKKSKSPWGRRLKRYRKLRVDFYTKVYSFGEIPVKGQDAVFMLRFDPVDESAYSEAIELLNRLKKLDFIIYAAFYEMERGTAQYLLRIHFSIPEYAYSEEFRENIRIFAKYAEINSRELYSAMADMAFADEE